MDLGKRSLTIAGSTALVIPVFAVACVAVVGLAVLGGRWYLRRRSRRAQSGANEARPDEYIEMQ
jgi:hypothetical protein